jgi:hypothetical protein
MFGLFDNPTQPVLGGPARRIPVDAIRAMTTGDWNLLFSGSPHSFHELFFRKLSASFIPVI